ncbi:MAG: carotenoid biosynthesis protein [Pyrobaculum sp.]
MNKLMAVLVPLYGVVQMSVFFLPPWTHVAPLVLLAVVFSSATAQWRAAAPIRAAWAAAVGFTVECLGVNFGFPFGAYEYGRLLGPKLGGVPLAIPLLWFVVTYVSYLGAGGRKLLAAALATLWDAALDPLFSAVGLWRWQGGSVPYTNYLGWLLTSAAIVALYGPVRPSKWEQVSYAAMTAAYVPALLKWGMYPNAVLALALAAAVVAWTLARRT